MIEEARVLMFSLVAWQEPLALLLEANPDGKVVCEFSGSDLIQSLYCCADTLLKVIGPIYRRASEQA